MKIKVADLEPNPYRKMSEYPVDRAKVEALKNSIKEKTFWDNILARPHNSKYQIAYGHHRWIALQELGIKEIDIAIRDLDDATMVQIMAEENLNWSTSPAVMTQTVQTAKEFLETEIGKYEDLNHAADFCNMIFASNSQFINCKKTGVGRHTLTKFLGTNWTGYKVEVALNILKDEKIDKQAVNTIPTMSQARVFHESVKRHNIPKPTQKKIANIIAKEGVGKRDIPDLVAEHSLMPAKKEKPKPKTLPMLDEVIKQINSLLAELNAKLNHVKGHFADIQDIMLLVTFRNNAREIQKLLADILDKKELKNVSEKEAQKRKTVESTYS